MLWTRHALIVLGIVTLVGSCATVGDRDGDRKDQSGHFVGSIHNHTGYSDGKGRPENAFAAGKAVGLNYFFLTEHSELLNFPFRADEECLELKNLPDCAAFPPPGKTEWEDVKDQGKRASDPKIPYLGLRGFEWSSPTLGHLSVLLSSNFDPRSPFALTMNAFWRWFLLDSKLGGGSDGLGTFNHPSRERHPNPKLQTFEDFRYVPAADPRMVGLEVLNRDDDYSACYARALGKGWHLGAIGAGDNHDDWGRADRSRTVLIVNSKMSKEFTPEAVREALLARRFYATFDQTLRVAFKADGNWMGTRLRREPGTAITLTVEAQDAEAADPIRRIEIYGSGKPEPACDHRDRNIVLKETPIAAIDSNSPTARLEAQVFPPSGRESWYFAKVIQADGQVAYTSPVWVLVP
jgi:hypothetical protein